MDAQEAKAAFEHAAELCRQGEFKKADAKLKPLEQAYPGTPQVRYLRGLCLAGLGRGDAAQALFFKLQATHGDGPWTPHLDAVPAPRKRFRHWPWVAVACMMAIAAAGVAAYHLVRPGEAPQQAATPLPEPDEPSVERPPVSFENAQIDPMPAALRMLSKKELFRRLGAPENRTEAMVLLGESVSAEDLPALRQLLTDQDDAVRCNAACLIGYKHLLGGTGALLESLAQDPSEYVRREAAQALGRLELERAADALEQSMRYDPAPMVRKQAAWAFREITGRNGIERLQAALQQEMSAEVRLTLRWMIDVDFKITRAPELTPGQPCYGSYLGTLYRVYLPACSCPGDRWPLLVSVHGTDGTPEGYVDMCCAEAEQRGFVVIAPYFDAPAFPVYDGLNLSLGRDRSDVRLLKIIDAVGEMIPLEAERFYLFGHSKGGQFVTRFVLTHPERILRAAACASGSYVMPNPEILFPNGLKPNPLAPDLSIDFTKLVQTELAIIIGTSDLERRTEAAADFMKAVNTYAKDNKIQSKVVSIHVPNGRHLGTDNFPAASRFLFQEPAEKPPDETTQ